MRTRGVVAATSFLLVSSVVVSLEACVGDDLVEANPTTGDAAAPDGSSPIDGATGNPVLDAGGDDARPPNDAAPDADAAVPNFCQSSAAAGAAFCVDFQSGPDLASGWDSTTINGGATITRNEAFGFNSTRSATIRLGGTNGAQGTLSKLVSAGSLKDKVNIQYDAYFVFPSWPPSAYNGFLTGIVRTASVGLSGQYYFDLERQPTDWKATSGDGTHAASLSTAITPDQWHHIDMTYDASGAPAAVRITVDGTLLSSLSLTKGTPPGAAPASFDELTLNAGAENLGSPITNTEVTLDNIIVRFP